MTITRVLGTVSVSLIAVFCAASAQADGTWKNDASGSWTDKSNWVGGSAYPNGTSVKAFFPATMTGGNVVTIPSGTTISLYNISISKDMTLVMDNGNLTISGDTVIIGDKSPATLEFMGATPRFTLSKGWRYIDFGSAYATTLKFVLPSTAWTASTAPIQATGKDAPVRFWLNSQFIFDAAAATKPAANGKVTYVVCKTTDGLRTPDDGQASVYINNLTVVNMPESMLGKLQPDGNNLIFVIEGPIIPDGSVVRAGHYGYPTAAEAFAAVKDGEVIQLLQDVTIDETFALAEKSVTLNLDGKTLTMNGTDAAVSVGEGAKLTVIGGTISAPNGVAIAQTAGELDVSNTTIASSGDCVAVSGAGAASLTLGGGNSFTSESGAAIRETSEEGAAHTILIDDDCRLATEEGTSTYVGQPSFVASEAFAGKPVVAGTFSSEIAAKYIPDSCKQVLTDDGKWRVSLALDPVLTVGKVTIDANACATFAYELKELGFEQTGATIKADYQVVGATGWTTVEIAKVTEEPFAGTGVIEGLGDGTKYAFRIYAVAGDRTSEVTEVPSVAVPFSKTTWTGAADDNLWSTAANWIDGHVAFAAQGVTISADYNEKNDIVLDKDATLSGLVLNGTAKAKISGGHVLTVNEAADKSMDPYQRLFCGSTELTVSGAGTAVNVTPVKAMTQSAGMKIVAEDGAKFSLDKWVFGDNDGYTFIATNDNSEITLKSVADTKQIDPQADYLFKACDGSAINLFEATKPINFYKATNRPVFIADKGMLVLTKVNLTGGCPTVVCDNDGWLRLGQVAFADANTVDGALIASRNIGGVQVNGDFSVATSKKATVEITGDEAGIEVVNGTITLGNGSADTLTINLKPTATWVSDSARILASTANKNATLRENVKFVVDLADVTDEMIGKKMPILSCKGTATASYALPDKKNVERVNNGNRYVVSFSKEGKVLYMTVDYGPGLMLLVK